MSNKDIIAKIKAEIERRMDKHWEGLPNADAPEDDWTHNELCELGAYKELEHLETFLSTLESEKPNDLEEAARAYALDTAEDSEQYSARYLGYKDGAKWQKEQMMRELSEKIASAYQLGLADKEKQMLKEAVEGEVYLYHSYNRDATAILVDIPKENLGDKVRVIVCKKEDEK